MMNAQDPAMMKIKAGFCFIWLVHRMYLVRPKLV
ncbi:MAG: hypothetical protein ACI83I_002888 [Bacteroidia bacterium]|jgi:hypothetical protein